ncbi:MAG TPA: aminoacetone oxidase family FAD-binding enzyme, partial [Sulfurospirillum cavolei]
MSRVAIIGAGASGLVCAIEAARKGLHVTLFEKNGKVGRKILATGNGKCNISNEKISL